MRVGEAAQEEQRLRFMQLSTTVGVSRRSDFDAAHCSIKDVDVDRQE